MTLAERLAALPSPRTIPGARRAIRDALVRSRSKLVVVDDDPTGTQTVHGVRVFMDWSVQTLRAALARPEPLFYVSTNSRSMTREDAETAAHDLGRNLRTAAQGSGIRIVVASRSDSTLRGHFPAEVDALASELPVPHDGVILVPAFFDAGRYTIDNIHWVETAGMLVPAHETEFARDPVFGFAHGDLREWIREKTNGTVPADAVICISLDEIRRGGPDRVSGILEAARGGVPIVANAACDEDLEVLALGVMAAEARGKSFIYRTGASFVKVRGGVDDRPLLTRADVKPGPGAGLVVAGSYVARTTAQIDRLLGAHRASPVEISVPLLLTSPARQLEVRRVSRAVSDAMARNATVLLYTTRAKQDTADFLAAGASVMAGLCDVVAGMDQRPGFVITKGGITSIALARSALRCTEAEVLGQIVEGVPVWRLGPGSRWSDVPYVVFPGNVGDDASLLRVVETLESI